MMQRRTNRKKQKNKWTPIEIAKDNTKKQKPSLTRWLKAFWEKFRPFKVHEGASRRDRRSAARRLKKIIKDKKQANIAAINEARRKAKRKLANRRNRKFTRAMHQRCRVGAYA